MLVNSIFPHPKCHSWNFKALVIGLVLTLVSFGAKAVIVNNLILFSAVNGRVLDHGKPMAGVKVERVTFWNMEKEARREYTTTDLQGQFSFPEIRSQADFGYLAKLFHVPTVMQRINLLNGNELVGLYANTRGNYEANSETGYPEIELKCDMSSKYLIGGDFPNLKCDLRSNIKRVV